VAEITDNKFQIRVFAAGEVVPPLQVLDAVQSANVECGHTASYYYVGKDPAFAFGTNIPFGLNARQQNAWWYEGGGREAMNELFKDYGIVEFNAGNTGAQMGGWYRKELKALEDVKGLKMRIGGFGGLALAKLGVVPQQLAAGDIYPALEKGTIDAAEWVGPYDDQKLGFVKVAPNYAYPGWWEGGAMLELHVNSKAYDGLSAEYKAIIECAAAYAHVDMQAKYDGKNAQALKTLVSQGAKLFAFPNDMMEAAFRAAREHNAELSAKNANWKKVYDDYVSFQRDANLWFRFSEATFDNFMQRQRL
jgi:TRAP-type mannitol/chloroaromatic compound transport system substrate-binding protein